MITLRSRVLYDKVTDSNNGGGGTNVPAPPPATPSASPPQAQGSQQLDAFGYSVPQTSPPASNQETVVAKPPTETPPKPEDPGLNSGYEKPVEPPVVDVKPPTETPPVVEDAIVTDFGTLGDADKKSLNEYFDKYKLPKEARNALVEIRKNELISQQQADQAHQQNVINETTKIKSQWYNELKADPVFGGANFDNNVKQVNRFITDFLPGTKKMLTEKGGMLPPSIMRDYHNVAKKLYETESFVPGNPAASETKAGKWDFLDTLYGKK